MDPRQNNSYNLSMTVKPLDVVPEGVEGASLDDDGLKPNAIKSMAWSFENEEILVEWGDVAQCYKWLHTESFMDYSYTHAWFTIPIIILSTSVGAASFLRTGGAGDSNGIGPGISRQHISLIATGSVNIFIGILATIQEYLKVSQLQESHRVSSINWDKFTRNIRIELSKSPEERMDAHHFIKLSRINFDCMMETSPPIEARIIKRFMVNFRGKKGSSQRTLFDNIKKPDICRSIVSINDTRRQWFEKSVPLSEASKLYRRRGSARNNNMGNIGSVGKPPMNTDSSQFRFPFSRDNSKQNNMDIFTNRYNNTNRFPHENIMVGIRSEDMHDTDVETRSSTPIVSPPSLVSIPNNSNVANVRRSSIEPTNERRISSTYKNSDIMGNHDESSYSINVLAPNTEEMNSE